MTGQQLQINPNNAIYAADEYGRPFIIVREQEKKQRMHGIEAQKVNSSRH
jgi:T-complex protein 1 subunit epsilon